MRRIVLFCMILAAASNSKAQDGAGIRRLREPVSLRTDSSAERQFAVAREYFADGQWEPGLAAITDVVAKHADAVVPVSPGRYVSVPYLAHLTLAALPAEGLAVYRRRIDPQAKQWFEQAQRDDSENLLRRTVREAFASSYGDDALDQLAQGAWLRGDLTSARALWTQMLPLPAEPDARDALQVLRYPDTNYDRARIFAQLALCSVMEGDREQAASEIASYGRLFPEATGHLAGRDGRLVDMLKRALEESKTSRGAAIQSSTLATLGGNAQRNGVYADTVDVGSPLWSSHLPLDDSGFASTETGTPATDMLSIYPAAYDDMLLASDGQRILAWQLDTGKPAWPAENPDDPVIYPSVPAGKEEEPGEPSIGVARHTITISEGRLFARLGNPETVLSDRALGRYESAIVCLDLARSEGKLVWKASATDVGPGWAFDGSPLVVDGHAYGVLRHAAPELQTNVACFDAETGRLLWNRSICTTLDDADDRRLRISNALLTCDNAQLFLSTDIGAIAAMDAGSGVLNWVATYERIPSTEPADVVPCLAHDGKVIAAPNDGESIMTFDAASGLLLWQQEYRGGICHLIAADKNLLIASGERLWGIDLKTGRPRWELGFEDSVGHTYGRGLMAGGFIYWPTREEIFLVDPDGGVIRQRFAIGALHGEQGGNLLIAGGRLVVAQPRRITAYSPFGLLNRPPLEPVTRLD